MKGFAESFPQNKQFYHKVYKIIIYNIYEKVKHSYRPSLPDLSTSPVARRAKPFLPRIKKTYPRRPPYSSLKKCFT